MSEVTKIQMIIVGAIIHRFWFFLFYCSGAHRHLHSFPTRRSSDLFHKQMDNRIKLLEEILSFRMQGVEFDNGDMYVDGHKAASDVRDEFVSVTEKLMDELAQCYNVLPQLDINNTIDHRPEGD